MDLAGTQTGNLGNYGSNAGGHARDGNKILRWPFFENSFAMVSRSRCVLCISKTHQETCATLMTYREESPIVSERG